jgi:uncharacterized protein
MPRPVHFEIQAADPERAIAFYSAVFGWRFERWGADAPYWVIRTGTGEERDGGPGIDGGLLPRSGPAPEPGAGLNAFALTITVDDLTATLTAADRAGATVALPRQTIPGVGELAYLIDPDGNTFGVLQPKG